jgi:hypothetical protein
MAMISRASSKVSFFVFHKSEFLIKLSDCQLLKNISVEYLRVISAVTMKMSDCQLLKNISVEYLRIITAVTMKVPSSGMLHRLGLLLTVVSEERVASIVRVEEISLAVV